MCNKCLYCGEDVKNKYCNQICQNSHQRKERIGPIKKRIELTRECPKCNTEFTQTIIEGNEGRKDTKKFCSRGCANSRTQTEEMNRSRSIKLTTSGHTKTCPYCLGVFISKRKKQKFCSRSCSGKYNGKKYNHLFVEAGRKSARIQSETRRSKNEIYFAELCEEYFKKVLTNEPMFNGWDVDVVIEDIKTAVMWNGKWHYEKITETHSVKQVQNRDKIKIKEIKNCGYKPYVIKDMGRHNKEFVESEFDKFIKYIAGC